MAKKNDAKRAAKKHAKEKKRQKKVAEKRANAAPRQADPLAAWKPGVHGIEGLARMLQTDSHDASVLAEHMWNAGRKDAKDAWIPSRVEALATEALLAELATRGVETDEAGFVALAEGYKSARVLAAEVWGPKLIEGATVHDRDLVGQAAEVLWARWIPGRPTDEDLRDRLRDIHDLADENDGDATLEAVEALFQVAFYERLAEVWDEARLDHDLAHFLTQSGYEMEDAAAAQPRVRAIRERLPVETLAWERATLTLARLLDHAKRSEEAATLLLDEAEAHPPAPAFLAEASDVLAYMPASHPLADRAVVLFRAAAAAMDDEEDREMLEGFADEIVEAQREAAENGEVARERAEE